VENLEDILGAMEVLLTMNKEQQHAIAEHIKTLKLQNEKLKSTGNDLPNVVKTAIGESMRDSADTAKWAMNEAITPFLDRLTRDIEKATSRATEENKQLSQVSRALSWKGLLFASVATLTASAAGALILSGYLAIWWNRAELESLTEQKAVMVENIAKLDKVKGGIKLDTCEGKPCIEVDTKHAYGDADSRYQFFWLRSR
jgi:hypothetical protein